jgi:hypothetical protein
VGTRHTSSGRRLALAPPGSPQRALPYGRHSYDVIPTGSWAIVL